MFMLLFWTVLVAAGLIAFALYAYKNRTLVLLGVNGILFVTALALTPVAHGIGLDAVQQGKVAGYHQFLNGSLVKADIETFQCTRDGPCVHEDTSCDSYQVPVTTTTYDAKGNPQTTTTWVTHYHSCPHFTQEFSYYVVDNFGNRYDIASHIFAANPVRWRADINVPGVASVPRGVPARWQQIKSAIAAGDAPPVTVPNEYENYILGSESTILKESSEEIKKLRAHKPPLLPDHTASLKDPIRNHFQADKLNFVGMESPGNAAQWQDALMRFNAALGMQRQGDMHVVVIKSSVLPNGIGPDDYGKALKAYWLTQLGKHALAKNGIMLVLGVDDSAGQIQWARAATGMPVGNNIMLQSLQSNLQGVEFTPDKVFGKTTARVVYDPSKDKHKPIYTLGEGVVPRIVLTGADAFKRACMGCTDEAEKGQQGFVYLKTEIPLEGGALALTIFLYLLVLAIVWALAHWAYTGLMVEYPFEYSQDSTTRSYNRANRYPSYY